MSYLVDTNVIIDHLRGRRYATDWLEKHSGDNLAISIIALGELYKGAYLQTDVEAHLDDMASTLARFQIVTLTDNMMHVFAREHAALQRQGRIVHDLDLLIAATALTLGFTLVTRNARHFDRVANLSLEVVSPPE